MRTLRNVFYVLVGLAITIGLIFGIIWLGKQVFAPNQAVAAESQDIVVDREAAPKIDDPQVKPVVVEPSCLDRAKLIDAPIGSSICKEPVSGSPALRVESGSQVVFGTITFDSETRVWILERFIVPSYANYSFDYNGREQNVLDAPFVVGSEKNPVDGENFQICWETESEGCIPPTKIEFFQ